MISHASHETTPLWAKLLFVPLLLLFLFAFWWLALLALVFARKQLMGLVDVFKALLVDRNVRWEIRIDKAGTRQAVQWGMPKAAPEAYALASVIRAEVQASLAPQPA